MFGNFHVQIFVLDNFRLWKPSLVENFLRHLALLAFFAARGDYTNGVSTSLLGIEVACERKGDDIDSLESGRPFSKGPAYLDWTSEVRGYNTRI